MSAFFSTKHPCQTINNQFLGFPLKKVGEMVKNSHSFQFSIHFHKAWCTLPIIPSEKGRIFRLKMAAEAMYKMKPICSNSTIADYLPTTMYKMKNFHEDIADEVTQLSPELAELKHRQEAVRKDLEKLKTEIFQIGSDIGVESDGSYSKAKISSSSPSLNTVPTINPVPAINPVPVINPVTIVVRASPEDPPLSLFLLQKLIQQRGLHCSIVMHFHSTLTVPLPESLCGIFGDTGSGADHVNSDVSIRLIWKDQILAPNLVVSMAEQSPILGEVNILRYLCRLLLPDLYNSRPDLTEQAYMDTLLDAAMKITLSENGKDGKAFIQNLNSRLAKCKWLVSNGSSLADIYCSIVVIKLSASNTLPSNVKTWLTTCRNELPGFKDVEMLCK